MFSRPFLKLLPLLILLLAFGLRLYRLDDQSLRGDEAATVLYAALPVTELWELSRVTDPHPPLYYLMLHPWQWILGESAWVMRYAGVMASVLAVAALYALSRHTLRSPAVGLLAAGLLALNPLQIWQAQDIRSYPFFTLFGLLSSWALWAAVRDHWSLVTGHWSLVSSHPSPNNPGPTHHAPRPAYDGSNSTLYVSRFTFYVSRFTPWLLYILFTVISLYTHYYTVFLIAFQGLFVLVNGRRLWAKRWLWLVSQLTIGLLILPGLLLAANFVGQAAGGIDTVPTLEILRRAATALLTGFTLDPRPGLWVSLLLSPVALLGLSTLLRRDYFSGSFWALYFAGPVLGVIALSIDRPFFKERFLIQAQPAFAVLLAAGFLILWQRHSFTPNRRQRTTPYVSRFTALLLSFILIAFNLFSLSNYWTDPAYAKAPPWRLYHDYVAEHAQPGDVMFTNFPEAAVSYYSPNELPFYVAPVERDRSVAFRLEATESIASAYRRIWFLPMQRQGFDEEGEVLNWLDRHADRVHQVFFPAYNLNLYLSPITIAETMNYQPATFAHGVTLQGFAVFDKQGESRLIATSKQTYRLTVEPGDDFILSLYWQAEQPTAVPYTVFTHLIAADGFNRVGQDNQPVWGSYPTTAWQPGETVVDKYTLTIPAGTPPGDHTLHVGWYDSASGERVKVVESGADFEVLSVVVRVE